MLIALFLMSQTTGNNPTHREGKKKKEVSSLATSIVEHAKTHWKYELIRNIEGKVSATNYYFNGGGYNIGILVNRSGKVDGISYSDSKRNILDISPFGIKNHLDAYIEKGIIIDERSSKEDIERADTKYVNILEKVAKDNNL